MAEEEAYDMTAARKLWAAKQVNNKKADRKGRRKKLAAAVDKRSLRATGRTEQFNIRASAEVKAAAVEHAQLLGFKTISEFVEAAILAFIKQEGNGGGP